MKMVFLVPETPKKCMWLTVFKGLPPRGVPMTAKKKRVFLQLITTFSILDKKYPDFLQKLVLVEISSKTRSFDDILILGDPIPPK